MTAQLPLVPAAKPTHPLFKDLSGRRFSRLVVDGYAGRIGASHAFRCLCDCGEVIVTRGYSLTGGVTRSCGCLLPDRNRETRTTHGRTGTIEYGIWAGMKNRCLNPRVRSFKDYGGRGIKVCDRWIYGENGQCGFECFLADMGPRPSKNHSLDRINNDGNYERGNVEWSTRSQQARNTRLALKVTYRGETMDIYGWSARCGVRAEEIRKRIKRGWSIERALTQPMHKSSEGQQ